MARQYKEEDNKPLPFRASVYEVAREDREESRHSARDSLPDYELPDHAGNLRRLSELQGGDPLCLVLARGAY